LEDLGINNRNILIFKLSMMRLLAVVTCVSERDECQVVVCKVANFRVS